jgi:hypothetical protein
LDTTAYLDFDLLIERTGENLYRARVLASPAGQATKVFSLPFTSLELENFFLRIGRPRRGVRRLESPEMENAKTFGGKLFRAVFDDEMLAALRSSQDEARKQQLGLRIRLRLNDAPDLVNLPWEYLYNPSLNRFLSLSINTPLVRYLELPERISPLAVKPPLRVLVVISSPSDYPRLDVEREWSNLKQTLAELESRNLVKLERLETATPVALQYALRRAKYHVIHFIGHGGFNEQAQDGILLMESESKTGRPLSGQHLGTILHDEQTLRLAVLNACEGARTGSSDPFAGVAQSLVQQGLPAVIAMQFEITDEAAIAFGREFYTAIAEGFPVDAAMGEARKAIFSLGNDIEWGTPVLYMRAPDGRIFEVEKRAARPARKAAQEKALPEPPPAPLSKTLTPDPDLEAHYVDGLSAYWLQDWPRAVEQFSQVEQADPNYKDTAPKLAEARQKLLLAQLTEEAEMAEKHGEWVAAIEALEKLAALQPGDAGVAKRLEQARQQQPLAELYAQARQLYQAGQWQAVLNVCEQMRSIRADFQDPEHLLAGAEKELQAARRQAELETLYAQALNALEAEDLNRAMGLFTQVQRLDAFYKDTGLHMAQLRVKLEAQRVEKQRQIDRHLQAAPVVKTRPGWLPTWLPDWLSPTWLAVIGAAGVILLLMLVSALSNPQPQPTPGANLAASATDDNQPDKLVMEDGEVVEAGYEGSSEPFHEILDSDIDSEETTFSDRFSEAENLWPVYQSDQGEVNIKSNVYWLRVNWAESLIKSFVPVVAEPTYIEFTANIQAGYGSYGVNCGYIDEENFYEVRFEAASLEYAVWQMEDGAYRPLGEGYSEENYFYRSNYLDYGVGALNFLRVTCQQSFIEVSINGVNENVISLEEPAPTGRMALFASTWDSIGEEGFVVGYDDVWVSSTLQDIFLNNVSGWTEQVYEYGYKLVENGGYTFLISDPGWRFHGVQPFPIRPKSFGFSAYIEQASGSYGVFCNYHSQESYYEVRFEADSPSVSIWKFDGSELTSLYEPEYLQTPELNFGAGAENNFWITCQPGYIKVWINDSEVVNFEFEEDDPAQGNVVLVANSQAEGSGEHQVVFDDFYINR